MEMLLFLKSPKLQHHLLHEDFPDVSQMEVLPTAYMTGSKSHAAYFISVCVDILLPTCDCRQFVPCLHVRPTAPGRPGFSYPERSFSITIFCSPAEMLLLPEPGVEAKSLVPVSGPLPGVLRAVCTSLRIRGRGPSLDTMFCKYTARGKCDCGSHLGRPSALQLLWLNTAEEPLGKAGPALPTCQTQPSWEGARKPRNLQMNIFPKTPRYFWRGGGGGVRGLKGEMVTWPTPST